MNSYPSRPSGASSNPVGLVDVLERVLDKGVVVAGDIQVNLLDIELLTIKVRLLLASVDTAEKMGIDWWRHDRFLSNDHRRLADENAALRQRIATLEERLGGEKPPPTSQQASFETGRSEQQLRDGRIANDS